MPGSDQNRRPSYAGILATLSSVGVIVVNLAVDIDEPLWLTGIGLACFVLAVTFSVPPFFLLKKHGRIEGGGPYYSTTTLVDKGVYSVVRHPQYVGYALFVLGFACLDPHWLAVGLAILGSALFYLQAILEEGFCAAHLGSEYHEYGKRVPRFNFVQGVFRIVNRRRR